MAFAVEAREDPIRDIHAHPELGSDTRRGGANVAVIGRFAPLLTQVSNIHLCHRANRIEPN